MQDKMKLCLIKGKAYIYYSKFKIQYFLIIISIMLFEKFDGQIKLLKFILKIDLDYIFQYFNCVDEMNLFVQKFKVTFITVFLIICVHRLDQYLLL